MELMPVLPFRAINCLLVPTARVNQQHRALAIRSASRFVPCGHIASSERSCGRAAKSSAACSSVQSVTKDVLEGALVDGPDRRDRRAEIALDRSKAPELAQGIRLLLARPIPAPGGTGAAPALHSRRKSKSACAAVVLRHRLGLPHLQVGGDQEQDVRAACRQRRPNLWTLTSCGGRPRARRVRRAPSRRLSRLAKIPDRRLVCRLRLRRYNSDPQSRRLRLIDDTREQTSLAFGLVNLEQRTLYHSFFTFQ